MATNLQLTNEIANSQTYNRQQTHSFMKQNLITYTYISLTITYTIAE